MKTRKTVNNACENVFHGGEREKEEGKEIDEKTRHQDNARHKTKNNIVSLFLPGGREKSVGET